MSHNKQAFDISIHAPHGGGCMARNGIALIGIAYIITTMIGPGALSLPWAIAQLGWSLGPPAMIVFSIASIYTFRLQAVCMSDDGSYMDAVRANLGAFEVKLCEVIQNFNFYGTDVVYTVASLASMMAVVRSYCFHSKGHESSCEVSSTPYMIAFGVVEVILSQISDFDRILWLPVLAAFMSFAYLAIGLALEIAKVAENEMRGNLTSGKEIWTSFQAIGILAYAYANLFNLNEIMDRIKSPPPNYKKMEKSAILCVATTSLFKMLCGTYGYAAFGDASPTNLLNGFGFYNPYWLVDIANVAVVFHLIVGYQIISRPLFASVEKTVQEWFPVSKFVNNEIGTRIPVSGKITLFGLVWRTIFVVMTTCVSTLVTPFINDVVGILGVLKFWPLTVYFPVEIYIARNEICKWSSKWIGLRILSVGCFFVSVVVVVGAIAKVISYF